MESILHSLEQASPLWAYFILFISAVIENIFPPIPGDTVTLVGAYLVGRSLLNFWGVYISTTLGSVAGFMAIYGLAYWVERKIIEKYQPRWITATHIDQVETWFRKYGYGVIFLNRFLSGVRSVISLVAGLSKMKPMIVFTLSLIGCAIWNGLLIYLGSIVGKNWSKIIELLKIYNRAVLLVVILVIVIWLLYRFIRKRTMRKNSPSNQ
jgi:membrane protein DedA with SNARE-associated domain